MKKTLPVIAFAAEHFKGDISGLFNLSGQGISNNYLGHFYPPKASIKL